MILASVLLALLLVLLVLLVFVGSPAPKVFVCTMSRHPVDFERWLNHHFRIGVDQIYLRFEETPEIEEMLLRHPRRNDIIREYAPSPLKDEQRNWNRQAQRQIEFCNRVIRGCPDGSWVFHIDDDELLYPRSGDIKQYLRSVPTGTDNIYIKTIEAVYPSVNNPDSCFNTTNRFVTCDGRNVCTSYYDGKSGTRVRPGAELDGGVHRFKGKSYDPPIEDIAVLHFESCSFSRWKDKFTNLNSRNPEIHPSFRFANESLKMIREGSSDEELHKFYQKNKVDPYYSVDYIVYEQLN
jgi:Glycosyl transferase family 2